MTVKLMTVTILLLLFGSDGFSNEIQIFGDSIFATRNKGVRNELQKLTDTHIPDHSQTGKWVWEIKNQYLQTNKDGLQTVILNGGGNDMFGSNCRPVSDGCREALENAIVNLRELFNIIAEEGREHIIFLGGHYTMGWNGGYEDAVDLCYQHVLPVCENSKIKCTLIDLREQFEGRSDWLDWDGIHPNDVGVRKIAERIFEALP